VLSNEVLDALISSVRALKNKSRDLDNYVEGLRRAAQELPLEWWQERQNLTVEELLYQSEIRWRVSLVAAEEAKATRAAAGGKLLDAVETVIRELDEEFSGLHHPPIVGGVMETDDYRTRERFAWGSSKEEGHYTETVPIPPPGAVRPAECRESILARLAEECGLRSAPVEIEEGAEEGAEPESSILREARRIYKDLFGEVECRLRNEDKYENPVRLRVAVPREWLSE
jgi:hypothetical protein